MRLTISLHGRIDIDDDQLDDLIAEGNTRKEAIMQLRAELQDARSVIADLQRQIASMESERRAKKSGTGGR